MAVAWASERIAVEARVRSIGCDYRRIPPRKRMSDIARPDVADVGAPATGQAVEAMRSGAHVGTARGEGIEGHHERASSR
jgi:hypothetical protein